MKPDMSGYPTAFTVDDSRSWIINAVIKGGDGRSDERYQLPVVGWAIVERVYDEGTDNEHRETEVVPVVIGYEGSLQTRRQWNEYGDGERRETWSLRFVGKHVWEAAAREATQ